MKRNLNILIIAALMFCGFSAQARAYEYNPENFDFSKPINESFNAVYVKDWVKALGGGGQVYADVYILGGDHSKTINFGTGTNSNHFGQMFSNTQFSEGWDFDGTAVGTNVNVKDLSFELTVKKNPRFFKLNSDNNTNGNQPVAKEISFWQLTEDFMYNGHLLTAGTVLFGIGNGGKGAQTYTQMFGVFKLSEIRTSATPIPAAAWLLGTGLVGLVSLRKRFSLA